MDEKDQTRRGADSMRKARSFAESGYIPQKDATIEPADYQEYVVVDRALFENAIAFTMDWLDKQAFPIRISRVNTSYPATLLISGPRSAVRRVRQVITHNAKLSPGELVAMEGEKPGWFLSYFADITNQQIGEVTSVSGARSMVRPIRGKRSETQITKKKERSQITRVPQFIGVKMQRELDVVKHQWERDREYHYFTKQMDQLERRDLRTIRDLEKRLESCKTGEAEAERFRIQAEMQKGELTELRNRLRHMDEQLRLRDSELAQARLEVEVASRKQREGKAELDTLRIEVEKFREEARIAQQKATDAEIHNTTQMTLLKRRTMELDSVCDRLTAANLEKRRAEQDLQKTRWTIQDATDEINRLRPIANLPPTATPIPEKDRDYRRSELSKMAENDNPGVPHRPVFSPLGLLPHTISSPLMASTSPSPIHPGPYGLQAPPQGAPPRRRRRESVFDRVELSTQIGLPLSGAPGLGVDSPINRKMNKNGQDPEPPRLTANALRAHQNSFSYLPKIDTTDRDILNPPLTLPNRQVLQSPNSDMKTQPRTPNLAPLTDPRLPAALYSSNHTDQPGTHGGHARKISQIGQTYKPPALNAPQYGGVLGAAAELGIDLQKDFGGTGIRQKNNVLMGIIPDNKSSDISTPTASEASGDEKRMAAAMTPPARPPAHGRQGSLFGQKFSFQAQQSSNNWGGNGGFGRMTAGAGVSALRPPTNPMAGMRTPSPNTDSSTSPVPGQMATEDKPAPGAFGSTFAPSAPPAGAVNNQARRASTVDEMMLADMLGGMGQMMGGNAGGNGMARPMATLPQRMDSPTSPSSSRADPLTPWECPMCTYVNPPENATCDMCSTNRPDKGKFDEDVEDKPGNATMGGFDWGFGDGDDQGAGLDWDDDVEDIIRQIFFKLSQNFPSASGGQTKIDSQTGLEWAQRVIGYSADDANEVWGGQGSEMSLFEWNEFMENSVEHVTLERGQFLSHCRQIVESLEK